MKRCAAALMEIVLLLVLLILVAFQLKNLVVQHWVQTKSVVEMQSVAFLKAVLCSAAYPQDLNVK